MAVLLMQYQCATPKDTILVSSGRLDLIRVQQLGCLTLLRGM